MKYILLSFLLVTFGSGVIGQTSADVMSHSDYKLVHEAISDYVEALYEVDSSRIIKSVDPSLRKIGYWYNSDKDEYADNLEMSYEQLVSLAAKWNSDYDQVDDSSPKEITIFEINDKSASAKLTAMWGIDYFHLSKVNGTWKIMNVLWQSPPR